MTKIPLAICYKSLARMARIDYDMSRSKGAAGLLSHGELLSDNVERPGKIVQTSAINSAEC